VAPKNYAIVLCPSISSLNIDLLSQFFTNRLSKKFAT